jgi:hypothetical protein
MTRFVLAACTTLVVLVLAGPALAQESTAGTDEPTVTFVHGIRGMLADVYLDDELILQGFEPERATEPMEMQTGRHRIDLREADAPADAEPAVTKRFSVPPGSRLTAIAHWVGVDECTITVFDESSDTVAAGSGRLVARHTAATDGVALAIDGQPLADRLEPMKELAGTVDAGTHTVAVNDVASDTALVPGSQVPVPEGAARIVYLVGTAKDDNLGLLTQTVEGLASGPAGVPTGNSGLTTAGGRSPALPGAAFAAALVMSVLVARRRHRAPARRG